MPTARRSRTIAAPAQELWELVATHITCRAGGRG